MFETIKLVVMAIIAAGLVAACGAVIGMSTAF
jgi:hypothetical protein